MESSPTPAVAWQAMWNRNAPWLRTVLQARLRDDGAVDEVLQEVATNAWQHRFQLSDASRVAPWLYRIAIRQTLLFWRRTTRQNRRATVISPESIVCQADTRTPSPEAWLLANESDQLIRQAVSRLPPQDREMLLLKHAEQWSYRQIAEHTGLSMDKVIYRLQRARSRVRCELESLDLTRSKT